MPTTLLDYPNLPGYQLGFNFTSNDHVRGDRVEFWIKRLSYGQIVPTITTVTCTEPVAADDEEITVSIASGSIYIYRGDVMKFGSTLIVFAEDTTITNVAAAKAIYPAVGTVADNATAKTYALKPLLSLQDGGTPQTSGTQAESRNRRQGLYSAIAMFGRSYTMNANGTRVKTDPGLLELQDSAQGDIDIYWECRYQPGESFLIEGVTYAEGTGPGAYKGIAKVNSFALNPTQADFEKLAASLNGNGGFSPYAVLV